MAGGAEGTAARSRSHVTRGALAGVERPPGRRARDAQATCRDEDSDRRGLERRVRARARPFQAGRRLQRFSIGPPIAGPCGPPRPHLRCRPPPEHVEDALRFGAISFVAAGLGYDVVSRRFVVGNRDARKLFVVDEGSRRASDLVGAASARFLRYRRPRHRSAAGRSRGRQPWRKGSPEPRPLTAPARSGRLLETPPSPAALLPARFTDVAVTDDGAVLALDTAGRRIFRARFGGHVPRSCRDA